MEGKQTAPKKDKSKLSLVNTIFIAVVCLAIAAAAVLGWVLMQANAELHKKKEAIEAAKAAQETFLATHPYPTSLVNDSAPDTISDAGKNGWLPCPGDCLKLSMPGWHHQDVDGYPMSDLWFSFQYDGGWRYFDLSHVGHVIRNYGDRPPEDEGDCPICDGTGWVRKDAGK